MLISATPDQGWRAKNSTSGLYKGPEWINLVVQQLDHSADPLSEFNSKKWMAKATLQRNQREIESIPFCSLSLLFSQSHHSLCTLCLSDLPNLWLVNLWLSIIALFLSLLSTSTVTKSPASASPAYAALLSLYLYPSSPEKEAFLALSLIPIADRWPTDRWPTLEFKRKETNWLVERTWSSWCNGCLAVSLPKPTLNVTVQSEHVEVRAMCRDVPNFSHFYFCLIIYLCALKNKHLFSFLCKLKKCYLKKGIYVAEFGAD